MTLYPVWTQNSNGFTYSVTAPTTDNGSVTVSPKKAKKGTTVTITVTPDEGYTLETITVFDGNGKIIQLTDNGNGTYSFKMPVAGATITASFTQVKQENPFVDVNEGDYFCNAVAWAVKNGITTGTEDGTHFSPDGSCTRAQLVTFLWRAAGCPMVNDTIRFTDVAEDTWYTEAIRWATSHGIVYGYDNGLFGTEDDITREQTVTILYRYAQSAGMDVSVGADTNILSYHDAFQVSDYAVEAMQWAVGAGIVQGYNNSLMPQSPCTRAQIVTMLHRLLGE